ncbi:2-dehydro-3-deoxygalactonokinase [Spirosoma pollinicola]|uniref:2-keto-3-deoxy-galactonokinase n=1 Tax=Spirosoma pollinicola TaxID=2057025 RepID=A0A2K8Z368_9BACT|nr:2-dehydro-3-deoxygalactonokinase [Spirosoma pollinicola]AUD04318.1 2-keto-3-deoxy-galactonokinase [Spirosoma pollinicola]
MKNYLLGCDWGTSSFRLRLIDSTNLQLIGEIRSSEGVASTFTDWKMNGESQGIVRAQFFRQQLKRQVDLLSTKVAGNLAGIPIIVSGMASSSIGMEEVPYATLPFPVDGSRASTKRLSAQPDFPHDITLISGVQTQHDVMRGEETQLIGLLALLDIQHYTPEVSILIFPGTHSKHIYIQHQQVIDFQTFMTGEVFNLMAMNSILKDSVSLTERNTFSTNELDAFKLGVNESNSPSILNSLFRVRTNQLFGKLTKTENALYLSGLLIGAELKTLVDQEQWQLILCSGNNLYELYKLAMEELQLSERTTTISADLIDQATIAGQVKIAQIQFVTLPK